MIEAMVVVFLDTKTGDFLVEELTAAPDIPGAEAPSAFREIPRGQMRRLGPTIIAESLERYGRHDALETTMTAAEYRRFHARHKSVTITRTDSKSVAMTPGHRGARGYVGAPTEESTTITFPKLSPDTFWAALVREFERAN